MEYGNTAKVALIAAVAAVAVLAFVAPAYSYSSTVSTTGTVTSEYITINVYDDTTAATGLQLTADDSAWVSNNMTTASFALNTPTSKQYNIVAKSNKDSGSNAGAYLYGYFTGGGVGINTITLTVTGLGSTTSIVLHRDAPTAGIALSNGINGTNVTSNTWTIGVSSFTADTFQGLQVSDNKIPVKNGGDVVMTPLTTVYSLSGLTFYFYVSWENILV